MRMINNFFAIITGLLTTVGGVSCAEGLVGEPRLRVAPAGWYAGLDAEWRFDNGSAGGTRATSQEFNADDAHFSPMIDISVALPYSVDIELGGFYFKADGSAVLTRSVNFGIVTFTANDTVFVAGSLADAYVGLAYRAVDTPALWLSLGAVAHVMSGEVKMSSSTQSDTYSETMPVVALTARAGANLIGTGVSIGAALQWISLEVAQDSVDLWDAQVYVAWSPLLRPLSIFGGYRYFDCTIDIKDNERKFLAVTIAGPFAGVSLSF